MIKKLVLVAIILVGLIVGYNLVSQILEAAKSGEHLSEALDAVYQLEIKNKELKKRLEKIQSAEVIEEGARDRLGLAKPGETIVIIPEEKIKQILGASSSATIIRWPNWLGWWKVFFK